MKEDEKKSKKEIGLRLKEFGTIKFMTQRELADQLGMISQTLFQYTSGKSKVNSEILKRLAELGADVHYILTGEKIIEKIREDIIEEIGNNTKGYDYPIIEKLEGGGNKGTSNVSGVISFTHEKKHGCVVMRVNGDCMSPTIEEGDLVLIDKTLPIYDGAIVAAKLKTGEEFIKRYRELPGGYIQFDCDNFIYDPITLKKKEPVVIYPVIKLKREIYKRGKGSQ